MRSLDEAQRILGLLVLAVVTFVPHAAGQERLGNPDRDEWQRVPAVFEALRVAPGRVIADVGAGRGYFTDRLSTAVGPTGRVFAVDIDERRVRGLREWAERVGRENVEAIHSRENDPELPPDSLDGALIVNAYHEMDEYEAMLAGIRKALKTGGRLVIIDEHPRDTTASRARQTSGHDIDITIVERDLEAAGFRVVERRRDFIIRQSGRRTRHHWMLVAERPADPSGSPGPLGMKPTYQAPKIAPMTRKART